MKKKHFYLADSASIRENPFRLQQDSFSIGSLPTDKPKIE